MDMVQMQRFVRRKQWCEEQLRLAETDPNFQLLRRTHGGGQIDLTETHKKDLRDARDEYQRAIDYLTMLKFLERWLKHSARGRHEKWLHVILPAPHHSALQRHA